MKTVVEGTPKIPRIQLTKMVKAATTEVVGQKIKKVEIIQEEEE